MIWIILATFIVVFIVGFRVLTSGTRRAMRRLSERLGVSSVIIESLTDQMGKQPGNEFIAYLHRPDETHVQNAAQVLLIWQGAMMDSSQQNLQQWHRILKRARLATPITEAQLRLALSFFRETDLEMAELRDFQTRYNALFEPDETVVWLH